MVCILNYLLFVEWELGKKWTNKLKRKNKTRERNFSCLLLCVLCVYFSHRFISSVSMLFVYGVYSVAPSANYFSRKWVRKCAVWGSLNVNLNAVLLNKEKSIWFLCAEAALVVLRIFHLKTEVCVLVFGFTSIEISIRHEYIKSVRVWVCCVRLLYFSPIA